MVPASLLETSRVGDGLASHSSRTRAEGRGQGAEGRVQGGEDSRPTFGQLMWWGMTGNHGKWPALITLEVSSAGGWIPAWGI
jgi:hypothetical protein